ncbi:CRTAC1 family protein [Tautonia sociabilis]|uniref:CRTAC1 family protein n=1 Tax=Tautonia sociabilis TaxID=2080755 RepID=A0A432MM28_9BACT|nr:CRTAC1 family protein [Tautonia sociabilis]RUL88138.1 CRTAC1 family protein [Tautonia sociabilis]
MTAPISSHGQAGPVQAMNAAVLLAALAAVVLSLAGCGGDSGADYIPEAAAPEQAPVVETATLPSVRFVEITDEAGISFVHENAAQGEKLLPETMGSGVAVIDYDTDGHPDLLFVNQRPWDLPEDAPNAPSLALYRNDGTGSFADVTSAAGLDVSLFGMGAVVGDIDNDSDPDLYITTVSGGRLFRNEGGTFVDVTDEAGAGAGDGWLTSGAFFDLENDGDLDLFLCCYVDWSAEYDRAQGFQLAGTGSGRAYGPPTAFKGDHCVLLRNEGDGTFVDVSEAAGIRLVTDELKDPMAKALGVAPFDIDGDGFVDLAVANDTSRNFLFRNQGDGTFEELGIVSGVSFDPNGQVRGAMGIDWAHFRNDRSVALAIANFANEMTALYVADDPTRLIFSDMASVFGLGAPTQPPLKFGLFFFDYDLDGRQDLLSVNGHLESDIEKTQASERYQQPAQLFWNSGKPGSTLFTQVGPEVAGPDLFTPIVGRGSAYLDLDGDGDLDVVMTSSGERARLFRNEGGNEHHWLRVRLVGRESNRDGFGARLELRAGDGVQYRQHFTAKGYLSAVEAPITFGLGETSKVDALTITWPSGKVTQLTGLDADQVLTIDEREGLVPSS